MLQTASGLRMDEFVEDMIGSMSRTKPVFIFDPDKTQTPGWIKSRTSAIDDCFLMCSKDSKI